MPRAALPLALAAMLAFAGCARGTPMRGAARADGPASEARYGGTTESADVTEIRAARAAQNAAIAARDLDRVASYWADDVTITAGLGRVLRGRAAYRAAFAADSGLRYTRMPEHVEVSAGWPIAFERGTWEARRPDAPATPVLGGAYAARWVKRDGRWLIHAELFVAMFCARETCDLPLAKPSP